jgi:hypothetical protein
MKILAYVGDQMYVALAGVEGERSTAICSLDATA